MNLVQLLPSHLSDLMRLKESASWNQTEEDWLRCLRLDPGGCIGFETDGRVVATATRITYGGELSWIGMVLTLPEFRGQGLARRLMEELISRNATAVVRLDASDMGKPLYLSLGFVDECHIERWVRPPRPVLRRSATPAAIDWDLDREVFGADRSPLLRELVSVGSAGVGRSYSCARPGSDYHLFGPCVAENPADAEALLQWFLGKYGDQPTCMDLFPHHSAAVDLAREYGFEPGRRLTRMVLDPAQPILPDTRIFAAAGFEFG